MWLHACAAAEVLRREVDEDELRLKHGVLAPPEGQVVDVEKDLEVWQQLMQSNLDDAHLGAAVGSLEGTRRVGCTVIAAS